MSPIVRTAVAIIGGVALAGLIIALVESLGHSLAEQRPASPFIAALVGYAVGAAIGASLAKRFAAHGIAAAWSVIAVLAGLALINLFAFAHPWWFLPSAAIVFAGIGWLITRRSAA